MAAAGAAQRADLARTAGLLGVGLLLKPFALGEVADAVRHTLGVVAEGASATALPGPGRRRHDPVGGRPPRA